MSISFVLVPLAIALTVTLKETAIEQLRKRSRLPNEPISMQTDFIDSGLLVKTLQEHGFLVSTISNNHISVKANNYDLVYKRESETEAFSAYVNARGNTDKLIFDISCLDKEYKSNVQSYTYDKLCLNLSKTDMTIEDEIVLEDDSILLTINI